MIWGRRSLPPSFPPSSFLSFLVINTHPTADTLHTVSSLVSSLEEAPFPEDPVKGRRAPDQAGPPGLLSLVRLLGRAALLPGKVGASGGAGMVGRRGKGPTVVVAAAVLESSGAVCGLLFASPEPHCLPQPAAPWA